MNYRLFSVVLEQQKDTIEHHAVSLSRGLCGSTLHRVLSYGAALDECVTS